MKFVDLEADVRKIKVVGKEAKILGLKHDNVYRVSEFIENYAAKCDWLEVIAQDFDGFMWSDQETAKYHIAGDYVDFWDLYKDYYVYDYSLVDLGEEKTIRIYIKKPYREVERPKMKVTGRQAEESRIGEENIYTVGELLKAYEGYYDEFILRYKSEGADGGYCLNKNIGCLRGEENLKVYDFHYVSDDHTILDITTED